MQVAGTLGHRHPRHLTPQAAKHSPPAKEQPNSHDAEDHYTYSSRHRDKSKSDKSSRCGSDKESSSIPCKRTLLPPPCTSSAEHPWKGPHVDEASCIPSESSHASYRTQF